MKRITLAFMLMASVCLGQNTTVFQDNMNVIYQHVNRSPVTTGLLLDYGLLLTDVAKFNGTIQSNNYVNRSVWSTLYSSLYLMKFNSNISLSRNGMPNLTNQLNKAFLLRKISQR